MGFLPEAAPAASPVPASAGGLLTKVSAFLFGAALVIALYLAWQSAAGKGMPGCGPESGCGQILTSRWSVVATVPVSLPGAAAYGFLLFSSLRGGAVTLARRRWEWGVSLLVLSGALWFTIVQAFILHALCPWCCAAHFLASAGVVALWRARRQSRAPAAGSRPGIAELVLPFAAVAVMAMLQSRTPEPERIHEKTLSQSLVAGPGTLSLCSGRLVLDAASLPAIGLPNSAVTAVALTDFTCPHCRDLHRTLMQLAAERPGQFRTVLLPAAFEPEARELHRIMLSLWRIDPEGYRTLAEELIAGSVNPGAADVLAAVQKKVNGRFYELAWAQAGWVQDTLRKGEELMALNRKEAGSSTLPQLMIRDKVFTGAPHADTLVALLDATPASPPTASAAPPVTAPDTTAAATASTGAAISFESATVDLGTVTKGEEATRKVTFTSTGKDPLIITSVKASCGCTTVQGGQQTVAPGARGSFELKLDTARFFGVTTKTVDVESNAASGTVRLTLKANIWSPVTMNPSTISFGSVLKGTKAAPRIVDITISEPEPLKIGTLTGNNPYFQTEIKTIEEGRKYQLTVTVPELGERPQNAEFVMQVGHPKMKDLKFQAYINPVDPIMVHPAQFNIPSSTPVTAPTTASVTVFCHDPAVATLEVTGLAYSGGSAVKAAFDRQGNVNWGKINLTFPAGFNPESAKNTQVTFHTNHPGFPLMTIPVHLTAPPQGVKTLPVTGTAAPPVVNAPVRGTVSPATVQM